MLILLAAGLGVGPARAQALASFGVGVGTVRYPGGTSFSSASFSPGLQYGSQTLAVDASASFASLPDGIWSSQGRGDLWVTSRPLVGAWRIGAEGILAGTNRTDGGWTTAAHGLGELLWSRPGWGFALGAGPSGGWIANQPSVAALHTRARAWWHPRGDGERGRTDWQLGVEPTRFLDAWFTDASAGVVLERGSVIASLSTTVRISGSYGSKGAGSGFVQVFLWPNVSVDLGGGSYLSDPYQGLPRAGFVTIGVRVHATAHARPPTPKLPDWSPLIPEPNGDSLVVRFRFDNVRAVAIAGDWNQWQAAPLRPLGASLWEGTLALKRGVYHFNLLVDGTDWVVPNGVATVPDGLGGMVGVLLVP
jgi:Glycogen recognition site of AMP-activated protein kinase